MDFKKVDNGYLHDIFLERLDTLRIPQDFSYRKKTYPAGTVFKELKHAGQREYFYKILGISKNTYENWRKTKSSAVPDTRNIYDIAKHFHTNVDFLLGNTDMQENVTEAQIAEYTGLELNAIRQLHNWTEEKKRDGLFSAQLAQSLDALNVILCDKYLQEQKGVHGWDALHYIGSYLTADKMVREGAYARFKTGNRFLKLEEGDTVIKADTGEGLPVDRPVVTYEMVPSLKEIGVYSVDDPHKCYRLNIAELYKASSLMAIKGVLEDVMKRQNE